MDNQEAMARLHRIEQEVKEECDKELADAESSVLGNARTSEQLRVMNTSELVIRISLLATEVNVYEAKAEEMAEMEKNEPATYAMAVRMKSAAHRDLQISADELDLRVPSRT